MALPILSERLVLRAYELDDVEQAHDVLYGDADVMRLVGGVLSPASTRAMVEDFIARQERDGMSQWVVVERESGLIAGQAGLGPFDRRGPETELSYTLARAFWGRGYATEAGRAVLAEAFGPLGLERVVAVTREANRGSRNVLRKLGFRPAGHRHAWGTEQLYFELDGASAVMPSPPPAPAAPPPAR